MERRSSGRSRWGGACPRTPPPCPPAARRPPGAPRGMHLAPSHRERIRRRRGDRPSDPGLERRNGCRAPRDLARSARAISVVLTRAWPDSRSNFARRRRFEKSPITLIYRHSIRAFSGPRTRVADGGRIDCVTEETTRMHIRGRRGIGALVLLLVFLVGAAAFLPLIALGQSYQITGLVRVCAQPTFVASATVTLTDVNGINPPRTAASGLDGVYRFGQPPTGTYSVSANRSGYFDSDPSNPVRFDGNQTVNIDVCMYPHGSPPKVLAVPA